MYPLTWRRMRSAKPVRPRRAGRGGFTLVEMMVSVALVLLMMLMFAEIYSLAQNTISTQQGIAENDQKARILSQVLRRDLQTRTFRSVYPFRHETADYFALDGEAQDLLAKRKGYFSFSENDPNADTDDVLQLTVAADQIRFGRPGERFYGKASSLPTPASPPATYDESKNEPEFDDGISGDGAGSSTAAEVSYFLRNGNLYRSVLLLRNTYVEAGAQPSIDPTWLASNTDPFFDYQQFSTEWPTTNRPNVASPPNPPRSFWNDFDYSAYRWPNSSGGLLAFHDVSSLDNDPQKNISRQYLVSGGQELWIPRGLGSPFLRFGHEAVLSGGGFPSGAPVERDSTGTFFGRYTTDERSDPTFEFPGTSWTPFDGNVIAYSSANRAGVDLMLPNVHSFDVEVWDDVMGEFVDIGYGNPKDPAETDFLRVNPFTGASQVGFYHASRQREDPPNPAIGFDGNSYGNRFDTWNPRMFLRSAGGDVSAGRTPYRPQTDNADPNDQATFSEAWFGSNNPAVVASEAPLRAIRITVRYLDVNSGQLRQTTIEESLID